jgi:hypothetical protein
MTILDAKDKGAKTWNTNLPKTVWLFPGERFGNHSSLPGGANDPTKRKG